ncbi:hypothetical protein [Gimesia maris]|uniref:hypothetical protein n=1 Tax=Gimesia maris TaxID=122 RepID=UPI003A94FBDE
MRIHESLQKEIDKIKSQSQTTRSFRQFVLGVVDESLRDHYGVNYSVRCFQSSRAISEAHNFFGIDCKTWTGHVCFLQISLNENGPEFGWAGFWDQDHHLWAYNEFDELIDLTISQLHLHPASSSVNNLAIPAIWWEDMTRTPSTMIYLTDGIPVEEFPESDKIDFDSFMERFRENLEKRAKSELWSGYREPIMDGPSSLEKLTELRHPWVFYGSFAQDIPMPPWVLNRIEIMKRSHQN